MATLTLRDRDAILTAEGLIFRVFGYSHPSNAYVCDAEYASAAIFSSNDPRAFRNRGRKVFYKFYEDEGWKLVQHNYPQYMVHHEMLNKTTLGVRICDVAGTRKPDLELRKRTRAEPKDELTAAMLDALVITTQHSGISTRSFGMFGSLLHGFHHPKLSDIDLIIYGRKNVTKLRETLQDLCKIGSIFQNEFRTNESVKGKDWRFRNFTAKEYVRHQRRKLIYALYSDKETGRTIKTEFEPVKDWKEISNTYDPHARIVQRGWTKILARVTGEDDAPFIPSIYEIEPLEILKGPKQALEAVQIVSYLEEFRMQVCRDEAVCVEGNLEEVLGQSGSFFQVTLTYCPKYYDQVLKSTGNRN